MSENEEFYDKEIAPILLDLSTKCGERGMHFLAQVEYDAGEYGLTRKFSDNPSLAMVMLWLCARSQNNIDGYIIGLLRYTHENNIDVSQSIILNRYAQKEASK
jgi:hypothetical protein